MDGYDDWFGKNIIQTNTISQLFELKKIPEEKAFIIILEYIHNNPKAKMLDIALDLHLDIELTINTLEYLKKVNFIEHKKEK